MFLLQTDDKITLKHFTLFIQAHLRERQRDKVVSEMAAAVLAAFTSELTPLDNTAMQAS